MEGNGSTKNGPKHTLLETAERMFKGPTESSSHVAKIVKLRDSQEIEVPRVYMEKTREERMKEKGKLLDKM